MIGSRVKDATSSLEVSVSVPAAPVRPFSLVPASGWSTCAPPPVRVSLSATVILELKCCLFFESFARGGQFVVTLPSGGATRLAHNSPTRSHASVLDLTA